MSLTELVPAVKMLPRADKLRLMLSAAPEAWRSARQHVTDAA